MKDEESLQSGAIVGEFANAIQNRVDNFFANRVVPARVIVGRVFLAVDDLFGVVERLVGAGADFVADGRFQIDVHGAGDVLARRRFAKERVERIVGGADGLVVGHGSVVVDAVFEAIELPALIARLDAGLA